MRSMESQGRERGKEEGEERRIRSRKEEGGKEGRWIEKKGEGVGGGARGMKGWRDGGRSCTMAQ